jgi:hypothetical protein
MYSFASYAGHMKHAGTILKTGKRSSTGKQIRLKRLLPLIPDQETFSVAVRVRHPQDLSAFALVSLSVIDKDELCYTY